MSQIRSPIFIQYRSLDKLFVFLSKKGEVRMEVYDRDHKLLKTQALSQEILSNTPTAKTLTSPRVIVTHLLQNGYAPTTQHGHLFVSSVPKISSTFNQEATQTLTGHSTDVNTLQVLPNGYLACAGNNTIMIWGTSSKA